MDFWIGVALIINCISYTPLSWLFYGQLVILL